MVVIYSRYAPSCFKLDIQIDLNLYFIEKLSWTYIEFIVSE